MRKAGSGINMRRYIIAAMLIAVLSVVGVVVFRHYSPFHVCLRYYEKESTVAGQSREVAKNYAEGLCKAKNPFRN